MTDAIESFIAAAIDSLAQQTSAHMNSWRFGHEESWDADLDRGEIIFQFEDGIAAVAPIQVVGTYNLNDGTFLWAWDHPSIPEPLRAHAKLALAWGQANGLQAFTSRMVNCTEDEAWSFTAVANRLAGANGAYRGPSGSALVFMTLGEIRLFKQ